MYNNSKHTMNAMQKERFSNLINYLYENNKYYKEIFIQNNIDVNGDVEDIFKKLPITTKKDIRNNYETYISSTNDEIVGELTSGSTGTPVNCLKTKAERMVAGLNVWQQRRMWDSHVNVSNYLSLHDINTYKKVGNLLDFDKKSIKKCFRRIMALSPRWLSGPASTFERYARMIRNGDLSYKKGSIKYIELAGEYADPNIREYIEDVFGCKTINHYGTIESWCIAYECCKGRLHVQNDLIYAETVNQNILSNDNQLGEIAITSLYNKVMPLLRYNIQDLGKVEYVECECGQKSQVITLYGGRTGDMIAGKKEIHGEIFFKRIVYKVIKQGNDCIEGFRVEQVELNKFIMYIVKNESYVDEVTQKLHNYICNGLGKDTNIEFKFVDEIPPLPSGKIKIFYSFVDKKG